MTTRTLADNTEDQLASIEKTGNVPEELCAERRLMMEGRAPEQQKEYSSQKLHEALLREEKLLAAASAALEQVLGFDDSFCEICNSHAPKKFETGKIIGPVPHKQDCAIRLLTVAIKESKEARE